MEIYKKAIDWYLSIYTLFVFVVVVTVSSTYSVAIAAGALVFLLLVTYVLLKKKFFERVKDRLNEIG